MPEGIGRREFCGKALGASAAVALGMNSSDTSHETQPAHSIGAVTSRVVSESSDITHIIVYHEVGKFLGWPANNGAWTSDGVNMLVGFTYGNYQLQKGHNISGRLSSWLARSNDMGQTWTAWDPEGYVGDFDLSRNKKTLTNPIDFSHPQFVMRIVGTGYHGANDSSAHFFYSYDLGRTWNGPYAFGTDDIRRWPQLRAAYGDDAELELTPRTDYIVEGPNSLLVFMSVRRVGGGFTDKLFCIRTTDGGLTWHWVGWVVPPSDPYRAVMSQTVRLKSGKLISAIRRRSGSNCWIDAYVSTDNGKTWTFLSKIADTGDGSTNGNPPALNITTNGRLVAVFGYRNKPYSIRVAYSDDEGKTWSEPVILRDDYWAEDMEPDLGYPRLLRRKDGKMIAIYYWSTKEHLHHIAATIWDAERM